MTEATLIQESKDFLRTAGEQDKDDREKAVNDLKMLDGEGQWEESVKKLRKAAKKPILTINQLGKFKDVVMGDIRQNKASIKVKAGSKDAHKKVAEAYEGMIRSIEHDSMADIAYTMAADSAVSCGRGAFRDTIEYEDEETESFNRIIKIRPILNPFTVYFIIDDSNDYGLMDAEEMMVSHFIKRDRYMKQYPNKKIVEITGLKGDEKNWVYGNDYVRIAEFFRIKEISKYVIYQLKNGDIVQEKDKPDSAQIVDKKEVVVKKVTWNLVSGADVLEKEIIWPGRYIPITMIWGKEFNINGERRHLGIVRDAIDSQRAYNYARTIEVEMLMKSPKKKFMITKKMIDGIEDNWWKEEGVFDNSPVMFVNIDPSFPGGLPKELSMPQASTAIAQIVKNSKEELSDTIGIFQTKLGQKSPEVSGVAIREKASQSETITFTYIDNYKFALKQNGIKLVDLIRNVYSGDRIEKILGYDDTEQFVNLKSDTKEAYKEVKVPSDEGQEKTVKYYNLNIGRYTVTVAVGQSFASRRQESAQEALKIMETIPETAPFILGNVIKWLDVPGGEEMIESLKKGFIPADILQNPDEEISDAQRQQLELQEKISKLEFEEKELVVEKIKMELAKLQAETEKLKAEETKILSEADKTDEEIERMSKGEISEKT